MKSKLIFVLSFIIEFSICQLIYPCSPPTYTVYVGDTNTLTLDGDTNSNNGASCIKDFILYTNSPSKPSWASNSNLALTFAPTLLSDMGSYTIQYYETETGVGSCTFIPTVRELSLRVAKKSPQINYKIPNYLSLRAAIPFGIVFPQSPCKDVYGDTLTYSLLTTTNTQPYTFFNLDMTNSRIYGTVPNSMAGSYSLRLVCEDSYSQLVYQDFSLYFNANHNPVQQITNLAPYAFTIGEGTSAEHIIPSGIYVDPDGDSVYYNMAMYNDFTALDTWITFTKGYEGSAKLNFVNVQTTTKTGFQIFVSDGIGNISGYFLLQFNVNRRPVASQSNISLQVYPNNALTINLDMTAYFTDPDGDSLTFTFIGLPSTLLATKTSATTYTITGTTPTSNINFSISANDGISLKVSVPGTIKLAFCDTLCSTCFGSSSSQCYSCTGSNVLDGTTCQAGCSQGKFSYNGICQACHSYCSECTGPGNSNCNACNSGYLLHGTTCDTTCGIGYFDFNTKCYGCASNCAVCTGETNTECTSCMTGYAFQGYDCLSIQYLSSQCLSNQFFKEIECVDCDVSCKTCNGGTNQNCIECSKGYMMVNGYCMACNQVYGMKTDDSGNCVPIITNKCSCPSGEICDQNNKCIPASPTCNLATFKSNVITLYCSQSVYFFDTIQDNLFSFNVVGPREVYDFEIKLIDNIQLGVSYQSLKFKMTPYSTYIGLNNEVLTLKFIQPDKIVSATTPQKAISNSQTSIGINDPSDAIPVSADVISQTFGYIVGFGTAASFATTLGLKICFGCNFNLGWGLINFIQIIAFIPLANFYFPGNVRSYVSILKIVNTAGQGMPNIFYLMINKQNLNTDPYNNRFQVMGINTTLFIDNCGSQISIFIIVLILIQVLKLVTRITKKLKIKNKVFKFILKKLNRIICYNYLMKSLILLYMFFYLSSLLTTIDVYIDNPDRVAEYSIGITAFCFLILFIFSIFTIIQRYHKKIEESEEFRRKISSVIADIYFERKTCARFYIPIYLLRRAVFMTIIVAFDNFYMLLAHCFVMLAITSILRPYRMFSMNFMAIFNEVMITIIMGFSGVFTVKDMNNDKALNFGWVWIALATFTILVNWVVWIGIQIYNIRNRKKKRIGDVQEKEKEEEQKDEKNGKDSKENNDRHDFEDPHEFTLSRHVKFVEQSNDTPDVINPVYVSPTKKLSEVNILRLENHYDDIEEEKVRDYNQEEEEYNYAKFRRRHRKMTDDDCIVPFGYSPTIQTTASPNKVFSADVSDEIRSVDSNEFSINVKLVGEVCYEEEKKPELSKFDKQININESVASSASTKQVPLYNSSKNILKIKDL